MRTPIYLDHAATSPIRPEVAAAMQAALAELAGNPSSVHAAGRRARAAVENALAAIARGAGALFHTDAVAAAGRVPFDVRALGVDAATLSAHKLEGPAGVGALYLRRGVELDSLVAGGHQERERRPGTENVAGIVGFGVAARLAVDEIAATAARVSALRAQLERGLASIPGASIHGDPQGRMPGTTNVGFDGAVG